MRFSSPISCITPLDARQESLPTSRRGEETRGRESWHPKGDVRPTPRTQAKESLERLPTGPCVPAHERGTRARQPQEAVDRARQRAARRVSVDTPQ